MADNSTLPATGDVIADEDIAGVKYQRVKLVDGTAASTNKSAITAKGTQGAFGLAVQDLKDSGRNPVIVLVDEFQTTAAADTLINTLRVALGFAAPTTGQSSYNVTAGKTFRAQYLFVQITTTTGNTTAVKVAVRLRANTGGAAVLASPYWWVEFFSSSATALGASAPGLIPLPDGMEFAGGTGIGMSVTTPGFATTTAAPLVVIALVGYEY